MRAASRTSSPATASGGSVAGTNVVTTAAGLTAGRSRASPSGGCVVARRYRWFNRELAAAPLSCCGSCARERGHGTRRQRAVLRMLRPVLDRERPAPRVACAARVSLAQRRSVQREGGVLEAGDGVREDRRLIGEGRVEVDQGQPAHAGRSGDTRSVRTSRVMLRMDRRTHGHGSLQSPGRRRATRTRPRSSCGRAAQSAACAAARSSGSVRYRSRRPTPTSARRVCSVS